MTIHTDTAQYEFSHGHRPRGFGYWGFEIRRKQFWVNGASYGEAKKQAMAEAKKRDAIAIIVLPSATS